MRFLLDHDVPETIAGVLARAGHEVNLLRDVLPVDAKDVQVLALAAKRDLVVVTWNPRKHQLRVKNSIREDGKP